MPDANTEDGTLIDLDGRHAVRFTRRYPVSRADLWSAITDPDRTARWAFRADLEPRAGGTLRFDYGEAGSADGTVLVWDEPSILEYEWGADTDMPWRVRFELTEDGDGTLLTFDHLLPDANADFAAGWHWHLDRLATHLEGGVPAEVDSDEHFEALQARYGAVFA